jgi:LuxR family transcriptional regulator, maltose regulon positive regulatory protein
MAGRVTQGEVDSWVTVHVGKLGQGWEAAMPERIPQIVDGILKADALTLGVGSAEWLDWLNKNEIQSFAFQGTTGKFTARLERKQHGSGYWVAYRKLKGKLHKLYLGKTEELTLEQLNHAGKVLSTEKLSQPTRKSQARSSHVDRAVIQDSLLRTKLYAPPARPDLIPRPHLLERLNLGLRSKLTLVCAPAGFGKTTLLSAWRNTSLGRETPLAWVSLEAEDNDAIRFWRYVCTALETIHAECVKDALMLLRSGRNVPLGNVLTELLNGITTLQDDTVLVLDDYHLIDTQAIHQTMTFLLEHLPPHLRLVLLTRAEPLLPLTKLRARGELLELRASELRFTKDETVAFLIQKGLSLSEPDLHTLTNRAEGWVVGLQLAALSMQGRQKLSGFVNAFAGSHRFIVDYLANEVLERQPEEVRNFLLETSILERLSGSLCDAVTRRNDGQQMLEQLESANLFVIPLDDERRWYRYHHLFAEFLRTRLEQARPGVVKTLHQKAAHWLEQHGLTNDAVRHLRAAGAFAEVARLVEQQLEWAIEHGEFQTLSRWLESIPEAEMRLRPRLYVFRAMVLGWMGQLAEAERSLVMLENSLTTLEDSEASSLRAEGWAVRAMMAAVSDGLTRTTELAEHALQLLPTERLVVRSALAGSLNRAYYVAGYPRKAGLLMSEARTLAEAGGLPGFAFLFHVLEGHAQVALGQLGQAACYREVLGAIAHADEPYPAQMSLAHLCLGVVLCEWNQVEDAADHLHQGLDLQQYQGNPYFIVEGSLTFARVQQAQNDRQAAWQTLETAERIVKRAGQSLLTTHILAAKALLQLRHGQVEESGRWLATSGLGVNDELVPEREFEYRVLARVLLAQGKQQAVLHLLERLRIQAEAQERLRSVIELRVIESLTYQAKGDRAKASSALNRALALGEPEGFIRVFVDEGAAMMALLSRALEAFQQGSSSAPSGVSSRYLHTLLKAGRVAPVGEISLTEPLSQRELEVLRLLARGLPNKGIARELALAPSTVKWYVNGLFSKLEVQNRTQALARASSLGLV